MRQPGRAITGATGWTCSVFALRASSGRGRDLNPTSLSHDVQAHPSLCACLAYLPHTCAATSRSMRTLCEQTVSTRRRRDWRSPHSEHRRSQLPCVPAHDCHNDRPSACSAAGSRPGWWCSKAAGPDVSSAAATCRRHPWPWCWPAPATTTTTRPTPITRRRPSSLPPDRCPNDDQELHHKTRLDCARGVRTLFGRAPTTEVLGRKAAVACRFLVPAVTARARRDPHVTNAVRTNADRRRILSASCARARSQEPEP
jgi:hypothetical protein